MALKFWEGIILGGIGLILILIGAIATYKFVHWMKEDDLDPNERTVPAFAIAAIGLIVGFSMVGSKLPQAVKAVVSPRVLIVEHLMKLKE